MKTFQGTAEITDEGVKKHFKNYEPPNTIFELVWNGFDANASCVNVSTNFNDLDGLESVEIVDDGEGIDIESLSNSFEKFNESTKKDDDNKHGSHGKGRLAFHRLCASASWYTKRNDYDVKIDIEASAIRDYQGRYLDKSQQHALLSGLKSGTCVVLKNFQSNNFPSEDELIKKLSKEFGWYLALNTDQCIKLNGKTISIPSHELHERAVKIFDYDFTVKVIRWDDKPSSEKSYNYLIANKNKVVTKGLSKANNKVSFHTSAYAFSEWLDGYDPDGLELDPECAGSKKVVREIYRRMTEFQREIYKDYLRRYVDNEINRFDERGYFPSYSGLDREYAEWRKENTKKTVREIYLADPQVFSRLNAKPAKILIRLLDKILVSNENDTVFDVLEGVIDLSSENLERLAEQLKVTTLENIISTIETLQRRQQSVHMLKEVMDYRFSEILETPDLQKIIESNTWLFGPQYTTLGAEEDTFTSIAKNLRSKIKDVDLVTDEDIENGVGLDGANRQVDLFLARKIPAFDSGGNQIFKCVIIEIKRPSISLSKKHLQQVDDYCEIVSKHPAFGSAKMKFEVLLIGRKISKDDYQIRQRMNNLKDKAEFGLVTYDEKIKCYVKDWYTIFDEFDLSNSYLLRTLNSKLDNLSDRKTEDIVENLQVRTPEMT
ncbi:ATP-binding protein [Halomonas sp. E19]|uniref:ATP-binding protein n=1 Tax=Halomonas sp. E19 TaxID=3397247 RepID=UPI004033CFBA